MVSEKEGIDQEGWGHMHGVFIQIHHKYKQDFQKFG